jgi:hypothetical protein
MSKKKPVEIVIGDQTYLVPVMNLEQLEEYLEVGEQLTEITTLRGQLPILRQQILIGINRENPEVTDDQLKKALDLEGLFAIRDKMSEAAGLVKTTEDPPENPLIGMKSTPTLQTAQDGPSTS